MSGGRRVWGETPEGVRAMHWRRFRCFGDFIVKPRPNLVREAPEVLQVLEGALATPRIIAPDRSYGGGVYTAEGELLPASVRPGAELGHHYKPAPHPLPPPQEEEPEDTLYLGSLMLHFGHFLLEVMPRLWAFQHARPRRICFHGWRAAWRDPPAFFTDTLAAVAGGPADVRLIERPTRFARLLVPSPTFAVQAYGSPQFHRWCQAFAAAVAPTPVPNAPQRIYVTRRGLKSRKRRLAEEERLEAFFEHRGFTVLSPETLSFFEQVRLMRTCRVLAGCEGSALHLALFMRPRGAVVGLDFRYNRNQMAVEAMGGHHALHFLCLRLSGKAKHAEDDLMSFDPRYEPLLPREVDRLLDEII
ncbi:MAG TPA: glycosyltransferase family 61 protein [Caulobacteraceae bacterium]|jgi:hypothetical protein